MARPLNIITHDNGTSGTKTVLVSIGDRMEILASHLTQHGVIYPKGIPHAAEQNPNEWWRAACEGTKAVLKKAGKKPEDINAISFSVQTQCALFVDENGDPLDNPYIWIDGRAVKQFEVGCRGGLIQVSGYNLLKALKFIKFTGGAPGSAKDQIWKYRWFEENKPELARRLYKMLDVKDYLVFKCTGNFLCSVDTANILWLFDTRPGKMRWSKELCSMVGVDTRHLPDVRQSTDVAGPLTSKAAGEMGLVAGTPVIMGGVDASCLPIGSGAVKLNDTHLYVGTSGWISTVVDKRITNLGDYQASVLGAIPGAYHYVGIMETSGGSLAWAKDHLADIEVERAAREGTSPFVLLDQMVDQSPPGANGLIFTPWLYGNRSPKEDTHVRGNFFNLSIQNGRRDMFRSILEGVAFHNRWMMECFPKKGVPVTEPIRFVGGGASSKVWSQIMADILHKQIQPVKYALDGGAIGAALITAVGLGETTYEEGKRLIPVDDVYLPRRDLDPVYDKKYAVFKRIYSLNRDLFRELNG